jgi:ELMO/CED-12 family
VRSRDTLTQMFQDSHAPDHWYFFAVTGLNITQKLLHTLKKGGFDSTLLNVMETEKGVELNTILIEVFDYWYFVIFRTFNEKWKAAKAGIMAFNQFLERVYDHDFLPNHHRYL